MSHEEPPREGLSEPAGEGAQNAEQASAALADEVGGGRGGGPRQRARAAGQRKRVVGGVGAETPPGAASSPGADPPWREPAGDAGPGERTPDARGGQGSQAAATARHAAPRGGASAAAAARASEVTNSERASIRPAGGPRGLVQTHQQRAARSATRGSGAHAGAGPRRADDPAVARGGSRSPATRALATRAVTPEARTERQRREKGGDERDSARRDTEAAAE